MAKAVSEGGLDWFGAGKLPKQFQTISVGQAGDRSGSTEVVFCGVCAFQARVWKSYRTHGTSGYDRYICEYCTRISTRTQQILEGDTRIPVFRHVQGVPGTGINVVYQVELTEVPGSYRNVAPVPVPTLSYSGYCHTGVCKLGGIRVYG